MFGDILFYPYFCADKIVLSVEEVWVQLILSCCATAHLTVACVLALYARHKVQYLSIAWIMGIFAFCNLGLICFTPTIASGQPGILHPAMMLSLVATCYLQSIYPLSFIMPGYLQWGRMWRYASPIIVLGILYTIWTLCLGHHVVPLTADNIGSLIFGIDPFLRLVALLLAIWYIINIFRLPQRLTHGVAIPRYMYGYSFMLGLNAIFCVYVSILYTPQLLMTYLVIFTLLNLYLSFRTLETMAINLPKPVIEQVKEAPTEEEIKKAADDFNEANLQRFHRIEFWMQKHTDVWTDNTFGRDKLCEETGLNRHLILECVRSQGYNNVHDYINSYRVDYLKRKVQTGVFKTVSDCLDAGFGTAKTARSCFEKHEGQSLDSYLASRQ